MIWNFYNNIRNLFFLCVIFIFYCFFFSTEARTQSTMKICDSTNKGWFSSDSDTYGTNTCTTKCSDLKVDGTGYPRGELSTGVPGARGLFGYCAGSATYSPLEIYKIVLGTAKGGFNGTDKCTIFEGKIVTDFAAVTTGQTVGRGEVKTNSCDKEAIYDRLYFYIKRMQSFAGYTVFPDNSGTIARTTSACANADTASTVSDTLWLDVTNNATPDAWTSPTKCWGKPNGWHTTGVIKADKTNLLTSISNSKDAIVTYDDFKLIYLGLNGTDSDGFYKDFDGYVGVKVDTDVNKNIYVIKNGADLISGLPLTFNKANKKLSIEISYYSAKRNANETIGTAFLFHKNGSNAELVGFLPGENGLFIKFSQD
jgi:hypothetical protein